MSAYAQLNENNIVINVITVDESDETTGIQLCKSIAQDDSSIWKLSSDSGEFRGNPAGIGYTYMENVATLGVGSTDIFIQQQPYESWGISTTTATWESPLGPKPILTDEEFSSNQYYDWDESSYQNDNTTGWILTT